MIQYGHFVGGKHFAGSSGRKAEVFQPMDGTVRGAVALASAADVRVAVAPRPRAGLGGDQSAATRAGAENSTT